MSPSSRRNCPPGPVRTWKELAVRHLLTMTPGLAAAPHNFRYPHLDDVINDFPYSYENFSYENKVDWVADFLHSYLPNPPGEKFIYCSACTYMLSAILQKRTGQTLLEYLQPWLLGPLGIFDARWQKCPLGHRGRGMGAFPMCGKPGKVRPVPSSRRRVGRPAVARRPVYPGDALLPGAHSYARPQNARAVRLSGLGGRRTGDL